MPNCCLKNITPFYFDMGTRINICFSHCFPTNSFFSQDVWARFNLLCLWNNQNENNFNSTGPYFPGKVQSNCGAGLNENQLYCTLLVKHYNQTGPYFTGKVQSNYGAGLNANQLYCTLLVKLQSNFGAVQQRFAR